jgi:hypothetical protein
MARPILFTSASPREEVGMRRIIGPLLALLMAAVLASPAQAGGAGAVNFTQTFHNEVQSGAIQFPCTSEIGTVTFTFNGVAHGTLLTSGLGAGTGWFTFTVAGDFTFAPSSGGSVTYSGHFANLVFDENYNLQNFAATFTLLGQATGSDGSSFGFHDVAHITVTATGAVSISFVKLTCG